MSNVSVTQAQIDALIENAEITVETIYEKVTVVTVKLENGFCLSEASGAVDPANYSEDIGKDICLERIKNRLWELEGYALQKAVHDAKAYGLLWECPKGGNTMEFLKTIQKRNKLNDVCRYGEPGPGGAYHDYDIYPAVADREEYLEREVALACIEFQKGPRNDPESRHGVLDCDLLEIVRDRLKAFQAGPYATKENEMVLMHVEGALLWMNKRTEDRAERNVLGTMAK